ncbi:hypothetical protein LXA43DRAFT_372126 [Ganoderma leucocontextum]|nr:hypothetical protein LXA43DRAFT_372126 [Ganoderma leucocontextum]
MGGCLFLTPVRTNRHDEHEESWEKFDTSGEDEDATNCWNYRSSSFHELKGEALRAGIRYLESIQQQVDERKSAGTVAASRQFLSDAGIIAAATSPTDEQALEDASTVIPPAVALLRSWLREPVLDESGYPEMPFMNMLRLGMPLGNMNMTGMGSSPAAQGATALENMLNTNFLFSEVAKHESCPPALHRVGLRGLWYFAKMADNNQHIYPSEARVVGGALARVLGFLPDTLDWKEFAGGLREMLQKCGEDEMSMIQG